MTPQQKASFKSELARIGAKVLHHGCCVGADAEAKELCGIKTIGHPPICQKLMINAGDIARPPKPCLARNRDIVDETGALIACPFGFEVKPHSGTWYTCDYAKSECKPTIVIWPDGSVTRLNKYLSGCA